MASKLLPNEAQQFFRYRAQTGQFMKLARLLAERQIEYLPIKGVVAGSNYPMDVIRLAGDHDIAVRADGYQTVKALLNDADFADINIDLHCELRHLDTLPWAQFLERSIIAEVGGVNVRIPCPEDHLRIMAVHWLNDGGQYKERLWDIYYAVEYRPESFDWLECLDVVSPTRRKWVITAIGLTHRYLGLNIDDLPFADEARQIPKWIIKTVEKEWDTDVCLIPLHAVVRQPRLFMQQLKKRFPPNPIQATIEAEGEFDERSRILYQLLSIYNRLVPSLQRIIPMFRRRRVSE